MDKSQFCFILYKPSVPGNIGASARAIKTMGFTELRLINPADPLSDEARMMAHGSNDILEKSKTYKSFEESVVDIDFIICTTAKKKSAKVDYVSSNKLSDFLNDKNEILKKIGIVFGSEESGLPNSILQKANIGLTIPLNGSYPSLNLSQAVMIIAYELSKLKLKKNNDLQENQSGESWHQLQKKTETILNVIGIKTYTPLHHRIIERLSFMKASDARLVHSVSTKILQLIGVKKK